MKDGLDIKTLIGTMINKLEDPVESKPPKYYLEKLKSSAGEAVRDNISYLQQATGKPVYRALKGLQEFRAGKLRKFICVSRIPYIQGISVDRSAERRLRWDEAGLGETPQDDFCDEEAHGTPHGTRPLGTEINMATFSS